MPFSLGVHVWIEVEGEVLPEYKQQLDQRRTTCFIPSQEGKKFCVRFQNLELPTTAVRANVFLDGMAAASGMLHATDNHATTIGGQAGRDGFESPFLFARLKTTDDESEACQNERRLRDLGTIRVQIEWVNITGRAEWRPPITFSASEPIYEQSKKASAHCASLGELELSRRKQWYTTTRIAYIDPVEFVFQYAPQDWLRANDIAPPLISASTDSRHRKRDPDDDGQVSEAAVSEVLDEEEAAIYQRLKAKLAGRQNDKRRKVVKREPAILSSPEIIDLTGED